MGTALALGHVIGVAIALWTFNARAGGSFWRGVSPWLLLISPEWFLFSAVKAVSWEITLAVWLLSGRPASPWGVRPHSRSGRITRLSPAERAARERELQSTR